MVSFSHREGDDGSLERNTREGLQACSTSNSRGRMRWAVAGLGLAAGACALVILYVFPPVQYGLYPRCVFHQVTGLSCPGCGALRAMHQLLHGHFVAAFNLNPLLIILLPFVAANGIGQVVKKRTGRELFGLFRHPFWVWLLVGAIVAFGIGRNLPFGPLAQFRS